MTKKVKYFFSQWTPQARYLKQYKFNAFRALAQILVIKKMEEPLFYTTLGKNRHKNSEETFIFCCMSFKTLYFRQFLSSESAIRLI